MKLSKTHWHSQWHHSVLCVSELSLLIHNCIEISVLQCRLYFSVNVVVCQPSSKSFASALGCSFPWKKSSSTKSFGIMFVFSACSYLWLLSSVICAVSLPASCGLMGAVTCKVRVIHQRRIPFPPLGFSHQHWTLLLDVKQSPEVARLLPTVFSSPWEQSGGEERVCECIATEWGELVALLALSGRTLIPLLFTDELMCYLSIIQCLLIQLFPSNKLIIYYSHLIMY